MFTAIIMLSSMTLTQQVENINQVEMQNKIIKIWKTTVGIQQSSIHVKKPMEESIFIEYEPVGMDWNNMGNVIVNSNRKFALYPMYSLAVKINKGVKTVYMSDIDSSVDLLDLEHKTIYRVYQAGSLGELHDCFWLDQNRFCILGRLSNRFIVSLGDVSSLKSNVIYLNGGKKKLVFNYIKKIYNRMHYWLSQDEQE